MHYLRHGCWSSSFARCTRRHTLRRLAHHRDLHVNGSFFKVSEEVNQALSEGRPIVALESTIYTHGYPFPDNVHLASHLESVVRSNGAIPATIGILEGVARVGLQPDELSRLASSANSSDAVLKVSRRDLGFALGTTMPDGKAYSGGTTVAATMILAQLAGIKVFATGGLGGVHRGVQDTLDVSADLTELGRTPVAVVASGCKAFLDIPKTLEYLETQGVGVATFADGRVGPVDFPAFWSRDSGCTSPMTIRNEVDAAKIIRAQSILRLQSGFLFANPIPKIHEIPSREIQDVINRALEEAASHGATGNRATPFILAKIRDFTGSQSIIANTALVESNVRIGAKIAIALSELEANDRIQSTNDDLTRNPIPDTAPKESSDIAHRYARVEELSKPIWSMQAPQPSEQDMNRTASGSTPNVFVAGMLAVDYACDYHPRDHWKARPLELHTSNPAQISQALGGVGHNLARATHLAGGDVRFCSAVADDINGRSALEALATEGLDNRCVAVLPNSSKKRTAQYVAVNDHNKDLLVAMADMSIFDSLDGSGDRDIIAETFSSLWLPQLASSRPSHLAIDANWPPQYLSRWLDVGKDVQAHITFEPVSNAKSIGIFQLPTQNQQQPSHTLGCFPNPSIDLATPNQHELSSMYEAARERGFLERDEWWQVVDAFGIPSSGARAQLALATTADLVDQGIPQKSLQLLPYIPCVTTKLGRLGVLVTQIIPAGDPRLHSGDYAPFILSRCTNGSEGEAGVGGVYMRLFPPSETLDDENIVSVNGVGDTFAGVLIAGLAKMRTEGKGDRVEDVIDLAQRASVLTLKSKEAVSPGVGTLAALL